MINPHVRSNPTRTMHITIATAGDNNGANHTMQAMHAALAIATATRTCTFQKACGHDALLLLLQEGRGCMCTRILAVGLAN